MINDFINKDVFGNTYRKDIPSPFNYTGGKYKLMPILSEYIPNDIKSLYDLFCGGGGFFINNCLSYNLKIYANDIIEPLIQFYNFLQNNVWETVIYEIKKRTINKNQEEFVSLRERYNNEYNPIDFFILCCCCTNNMMRFNKNFKFNQTWGDRIFNKNTESKLREYHKRIYNNNNLVFFSGSFDRFVIEDSHALVYLDPPYMITEAGYNCYWSDKLELKLYDFIDNLNSKGVKFIMSNVLKHKGVDNPYINRMKKYEIVKINHNYDKVSRSGDSHSEEIIIKNY